MQARKVEYSHNNWYKKWGQTSPYGADDRARAGNAKTRHLKPGLSLLRQRPFLHPPRQESCRDNVGYLEVVDKECFCHSDSYSLNSLVSRRLTRIHRPFMIVSGVRDMALYLN